MIDIFVISVDYSMSRRYWVEPIHLMDVDTVERIYECLFCIDGVSNVVVSYDGITVTASLWDLAGPVVLTEIVRSLLNADTELVRVSSIIGGHSHVLMLPSNLFEEALEYIDIEEYLGFVIRQDNVPECLRR